MRAPISPDHSPIPYVLVGGLMVLALFGALFANGIQRREAQRAQCLPGEVFISGAHQDGRFCVPGRRVD